MDIPSIKFKLMFLFVYKEKFPSDFTAEEFHGLEFCQIFCVVCGMDSFKPERVGFDTAGKSFNGFDFAEQSSSVRHIDLKIDIISFDFLGAVFIFVLDGEVVSPLLDIGVAVKKISKCYFPIRTETEFSLR